MKYYVHYQMQQILGPAYCVTANRETAIRLGWIPCEGYFKTAGYDTPQKAWQAVGEYQAGERKAPYEKAHS